MSVCFSIGVKGTGVTKERQGYKAERTTRVEYSRGDGRRVGAGEVCERKGVTECNDNARFMQPCTAEELANAACNFFSPIHPSVPLSRAELQAAVMQLQSGVSLGERKLRELHCARTLLLPPKFIREDASVPP